jgi:hypothetical protein
MQVTTVCHNDRLESTPEFVTWNLSFGHKIRLFCNYHASEASRERTTGMKLFAVTNRKHVRLSLPGSRFWQIVFSVAVVEALLCVLPFELAGAISAIHVFLFGS